MRSIPCLVWGRGHGSHPFPLQRCPAKEEELVLRCYQPLRVVRVVRGATDYTGVDDVVEVEAVPADAGSV